LNLHAVASSGSYADLNNKPTTANITEDTNLYYTDARARAAVSVSGSLSYNSTTGVFSYTTPSTSDITEGTNLYFTDARVRAAVSAGTNLSYNSTTGVFSTTLTQYTDALARAAVSAGTGLSYNSTTGVFTNSITQYTDALARAAVSATGSLSYNSTTGVFSYTTPSTSGIAEGSNLYYTDARARAAHSAGTGISYNSTTGAISSTITQYTDALARAAVSAGTGLSYNSSTGVFTNTITQYTDALAVSANTSAIATAKSEAIASAATDATNKANAAQAAAISAVTNGAGAAFDTLKEIQDAMATDAELAAAIASITVGNATQTIAAGTGLSGGGSFTANQTATSTVTLSLGTAGTSGTYTKVTTDAYGRVTSGTTLSSGDIPSLSGIYLPLTGGTLTGALTINAGGGYPLQTTTNQRYQIGVKNTSASAQTQGWWLAHDTGGNFVFHADSNGDKVSIAASGFGLQVGVASTYDNPGGWNANVVASGTNHARVRVKGTTYNSSGDNEAYLWVDNTVGTHRTGLYSSTNFNMNVPNLYESGNRVLNSSNYNSYSPTLTGGGASGTWNINITGTAGSAILAPNYLPLSGGTMTGIISMAGTQIITTAGYAGIEYYNAAGTWQGYIGTENNAGNLRYNSRLGTHRWYANSTSIGAWDASMLSVSGAVLTTTGASSWGVYSNTNGVNQSGIWFSTNVGELLLRKADGSLSTRIAADGSYAFINNNNILHAGNYNSYALPLTGGTVSGTVRINSQLQVGQNTNGTAWIDAFGGIARFGRDSTSYGLQLDGSNYATFQNANGYLSLGPLNSSWCHFGTDRPRFYFGTSVTVDGNLQRYSDGATYIHSANYSSYALPLSGGTVAGPVTITGNDNQLIIDATSGPTAGIFLRHSGVNRWEIYNSSTSSFGLYNYTTGQSEFTIANATGVANFRNTPTAGGNAILHAGNWTNYVQVSYSGWPGYPGTDANTFLGGSWVRTSFTYSNNAPLTGTIATFPSSGYDLQLNANYNGHDLYFRSRNGDAGSWMSWKRVLTDNNYTSYSPSLTGSGASGTWGISITGNAATAGGLAVHSTQSTQNSANQIVRTQDNGYTMLGWINTTSGDSGIANRLTRIYSSYDEYVRYSTLTDFKVHMGLSAKNNYSRRIDYTSDANYHVGSMGHSGYGANETFHGGSGFFDIWSGTNYPPSTSHIHGFNALHYTTNSLGSTGGNAYGIQVAGQYDQGGLIFTRACSGGSFSAWRRQIDDVNFSSYALPLSGGTVTGQLTTNHQGNGVPSISVNTGGSENWRAINVRAAAGEDNFGIGYSTTSRSVFGRNNLSFHCGAGDSVRFHSNGWDTMFEVAGATGNAWLKGGLGIGVIPDVRLSINGDSHFVGILHLGGTPGSVGSWGSRDYTTSGNRYINANYFEVNNYGYGSTWTLAVDNSSARYKGNAILHAGNYTSYSPSLGGSGASGTWGINITGTAGNTTVVSSSGYGNGTYTWRQESGTFAGYNGWASYLISNHGDGATYYNQTIIMPFWAAPRYSRLEGGTFRGPYQFITEENIASFTYPLAAKANRANGNFYIDDNYGNGVVGVYSSYRYQGVFAMGDSYKLPADGTSTGSLYGMAWSHPNTGGTAGNLSSHGLLLLQNGGFMCALSTNIVAAANITAYSDERLKTNWQPMPDNYVARLAEVKVGIYDRTDQEDVTQVGVSAQSFQKLLPQAIMTAKDEMQTLSVSYGNAALASAVELAKHIVKQDERIARLEALIQTLLKE
jgi:hypothetical protein